MDFQRRLQAERHRLPPQGQGRAGAGGRVQLRPVQRENYCIGVPIRGTWAEVFTSDAEEFGGGGVTNGTAIKTQDVPMHGCDQSVSSNAAQAAPCSSWSA